MIKAREVVYEYYRRDENNEIIGSEKAIDGVSFDIKDGEFISIVGHNGCGKSTLAKHLNALICPTEGTLWVDGMNTADDDNIFNIRQCTGMVFQNPDNQLVANVVEEDVGFGPENIGVPTDEIWKRVNDALKIVNIEKRRKDSPNHLSGGQKQRVAIAGVLAMKPKCIVLDEPTAMLDPSGRKEVIDAITMLNKKEKINIILITHHMEETLNSDRIIVMDGGKIVMEGSPETIFKQAEELKKHKLCVPQATQIADLLKNKGIDIDKTILTREELVNEILEKVDMQNIKQELKQELKQDSKQDIDLKENNIKQELKQDSKQDTDLKENNIKRDLTLDTAQNFDADTITSSEKQLQESDNKNDNTKIKLIETKDLSYIYEKGTVYERTALSNVNITINKGEFVALIGHTGSGKSTLIQTLNGLVKPTSGVVYYNGKNIHDKGNSLKKLRSKVGLVFQYPEYQLFAETVIEDVKFGPKNIGMSPEEINDAANEALKMTGVSDNLYEASPLELSGGEKRRIAIAGVLAMKPEVLILDEPTAGLDPAGRDEILGLISELHKNGLTIILVSHSMSDVAEYADKIYVMDDGCLFAKGTPSEVFKGYKELEKIGLSAPETVYIMEKLKKKIPHLEKYVSTEQSFDIITPERAADAIYSLLKGKEKC